MLPSCNSCVVREGRDYCYYEPRRLWSLPELVVFCWLKRVFVESCEKDVCHRPRTPWERIQFLFNPLCGIMGFKTRSINSLQTAWRNHIRTVEHEEELSQQYWKLPK